MTKFENSAEKEALYEKIKVCLDENRVFMDAPMSRYTSFRAGGNADMLVIVESPEELKAVLALLHKEQTEHILLGNGSNLLILDGGYKGVIVKLGECFNRVEVCGSRLRAYAGARLSAATKAAMENGLTGMEFACGIPGSVGGGVFMNAGAYGGELADVLSCIHVMTKDGSQEYSVKAEDAQLSYRHSLFHDNGDVILSAEFNLATGAKDEIAAKMKELMEKRNTKQPVNLPSGGSFFKRPEGHFAGRLIEDAGLKGLSVGDAQVSPLHAGFIVNNGSATASDIVGLMKLVQHTVFDKFHVWLEPEVRILGQQ